MSQPPGFQSSDDHVCKLYKSLYGLKQSGKIWKSSNLTKSILDLHYVQSVADPCLFFKTPNNYALIYVDDIILVGPDQLLLSLLQIIEFNTARKMVFKIIGPQKCAHSTEWRCVLVSTRFSVIDLLFLPLYQLVPVFGW